MNMLVVITAIIDTVIIQIIQIVTIAMKKIHAITIYPIGKN